jgi:ribonuclease P protein component
MKIDESFGKEYKLCSQKIIDLIFEKNQKVKQFPFILSYVEMVIPSTKSFQIVISAPKRIFRKAHERNRIKRLMREAIRKKKVSLEIELIKNQKQLALFLVYTSKEELKYEIIEQKIEQLLNKLNKEIIKE